MEVDNYSEEEETCFDENQPTANCMHAHLFCKKHESSYSALLLLTITLLKLMLKKGPFILLYFKYYPAVSLPLNSNFYFSQA